MKSPEGVSVSASKSELTIEEMKALAKEEAKQAWEDYLSTKKPSLDLLKGGGGGTPNTTCHCSYIVDDVQLTYPDGYPNVALEFGTPSNSCDPLGNPWTTCDYIQALYNSFYPDCVTIFNPDCADVWASLPPSYVTPHPFNCLVDAHSAFQVQFAAIALAADNCGLYNYFNTASITFRIYCQDDTNACGGYGYVTDPITISFESPDYYENTIICLTGDCGCIPVPSCP